MRNIAADHSVSTKLKIALTRRYFFGQSQGGDMNRQPAVYILSNRYRGTLYTGVTSNLISRVWQHKTQCVQGFTQRYSLDRLVYYELTESMESAITREKQIKAGSRVKKINLVESINPAWEDLYPGLL
jgi:putative endonuclease